MFSIIIPSLNNLSYLKLCIESIKNNSKYNHEIIVHVNQGHDGTINFLNSNNIKFSFTEYNAGICEGVNKASKLANTEFILYSHDDFYFCPEWDTSMVNEIKKLPNNLFYLSGTMIEKRSHKNTFLKELDNNPYNFQEKKFLENYKKLKFSDFQGSTWAPHLIHKEIWDQVGGLSEEFYPGTGSDPDLNKKLWDIGVRVFKGLGSSRVFHFGSTVTRKFKENKKIITETGNKGGKIFLLKWGFTIKFFRKFYLKSETNYEGPLVEPKKDLIFLFNLFKCKIFFFYIKYIYKFKNEIKIQ